MHKSTLVKRNIVLFITILKRDWLEMLRYPFNMAAGIVTLYLLFLMIFIGYKHIAPNNANFGNNIDGIVVGFMLWTFALLAYSFLAGNIMEEARIGTLEQLYMTQLGFDKLCVFRIIASFLLNFLFVIPTLILMMATTGRWLHIDLLSLIPVSIFTLASVYGLGFICGGLGLIFKQIQAFIGILQFFLVGFIAAPVDKIPWLKILPLSLGTKLISKMMVNKLSIMQLPKTDLFFLFLNGSIYFIIGFYIFQVCEKVAKQKALLGQY